jgi:hypothetical protein
MLKSWQRYRNHLGLVTNSFTRISLLPSPLPLFIRAVCCFQVHGMWLPHWLAVRVVRCQVGGFLHLSSRILVDFSLKFSPIMHLQEVASAIWQVHGKHVLGPLMQKVILFACLATDDSQCVFNSAMIHRQIDRLLRNRHMLSD